MENRLLYIIICVVVALIWIICLNLTFLFGIAIFSSLLLLGILKTVE